MGLLENTVMTIGSLSMFVKGEIETFQEEWDMEEK